MYRRAALLLGGLVLLGTASLLAQDAVLGQLYGSGVHAFFSQDYYRACEYFTSAIDGGSKDPRVYYYRGLTFQRLGRGDEAKMDFQQGAELEAGDVSNFYDVGRALERVQGRERLLLEQQRGSARMLAWQRAEAIRRARYEEIRRQESRVLREQAKAAGSPGPAGAAAPAPTVTSPFETGPIAAPSEEKAAGAVDKAVEEKMEEPAAPATPSPPAPSDPFAAPAA
ncbi:MAG: hypothetical protein HUU20_27035, partial [Pirellulales bacterium]|nr:hypothetical protein [Pirellulales bacterium]